MASMSIRDAFLADVAANPDDNAPRLVFADWLEENGEPERAEFIRIQCRLAEMDPYDLQRRDLVRSERRLLDAFGTRWATQDGLTRWIPENRLDGPRPWARYRRGFIEYVYFYSPEHFLATAEPLSRRTPLRDIRLHSPQPIEGVAEDYLWRISSRLCMEVRGLPPPIQDPPAPSSYPEPEEFRRLLDSPWFGRLRGFHTSSLYFDQRALEVLLSAPLTARLRELDLSGCPLLVGNALAPFVTARTLGDLESLRLDGCSLWREGMEAIIRSPGLGKLRRLSLCVWDLRDRMGSDVAHVLCSTQRLKHLEWLRLRGQEIGAEGLTMLAGWSGLKGLKRLDLAGNCAVELNEEEAHAEALGELACSPNWGGLLELNLDDGSIPTLEALEAVLASANLATLRVLTFRGEWLWSEDDSAHDEAARLLARCRHLADDVLVQLSEEGLSAKARRLLQRRFGERFTLLPTSEVVQDWEDWAEVA